MIVYKYYLCLNRRRKEIVKLIFASVSSLPAFPSYHPNNYISNHKGSVKSQGKDGVCVISYWEGVKSVDQ